MIEQWDRQTPLAGLGSIRGQGRVIGMLERALDAERLHHAFLFTGPAGVGKATTAVAMAQALNCLDAPGRGCGSCAACDRIGRLVHPDLVPFGAEAGGGKRIKIERIRGLEDRLHQGAHEGRALVLVLDEVERLTTSAANALLKNLEEPRPGVHFVLVSAAPHRVPITVRSRCQVVRFAPLDRVVLGELAVSELGLAPDDLARVTRLADGSLTRAAHFSGSEAFRAWEQWTTRLASAKLPRRDLPGQAQALLADVDDPEAMLGMLMGRLRDHLLLAAGADMAGDESRLTQVEPDGAEAEAARRTPVALVQRRIRATQAGLRDLQGYVNKQLAFERLLVEWMQA